jgi:sugar phosphate isomerase/epimerase
MSKLKIGAVLSSFRLNCREALESAGRIGLDGIQLSNLAEEIMLEEISEKQASGIQRMCADNHLVVTAVCGDIGGFALEDEGEAKRRVQRTCRIMESASLLNVSIVQTHIGVISEDFTGKKMIIMRKCLDDIGGFGEKKGVCLAAETGPEPAAALKRFLNAIQNPAIKVNYDPANLVMNGFDCIQGVKDLKDYIIHTHAKDGCPVRDARGRRERPLGKGDVNFPLYIKAMNEIGYNGFYTIERECGENPAADIAEAKRFLEQF